jgi:hypothetical protein
MALIKIKSGVYGYRRTGSMAVTQKTSADPPFEVDDAKAARLVAAKVAVYADAPAQTAAGNDGGADILYTLDGLLALTRPALDAIAAKLGIDSTKCKNKTEAAELILAAVNSLDEDDEENSDEDDESDENGSKGGGGNPLPPFTGSGDGDVVV